VIPVAVSKRALDVVVGGLVAVTFLPLLLALAVGVALSLKCWPFFHHERPGKDGRPVDVYKLRTLPPDTPRYADKFFLDIEHMPLPWFCRLLRKSHLDELPQIFQVVSGGMSLVGPRPAQRLDVEAIDEKFNAIRTSVRPGCTGLWQLSSSSCGSLAEAPEFDLFYLANASVRLDLWIILRTTAWMVGLARPIELADIPSYLLGPGLAPATGGFTAADAGSLEAYPSPERTILLPAQPQSFRAMAQRTAQSAD
jgi:lipopolysaccharide/colanic/teichoic acid biosynthesis glycosyltransferase